MKKNIFLIYEIVDEKLKKKKCICHINDVISSYIYVGMGVLQYLPTLHLSSVLY